MSTASSEHRISCRHIRLGKIFSNHAQCIDFDREIRLDVIMVQCIRVSIIKVIIYITAPVARTTLDHFLSQNGSLSLVFSENIAFENNTIAERTQSNCTALL